MGDTRVGDEHVDLSAHRPDLFDAVRVRQVGDDDLGTGSGTTHVVGDALQLGGIARHQYELVALRGVIPDKCFTDARGGTGHEHATSAGRIAHALSLAHSAI